jgi:hypothetical protein
MGRESGRKCSLYVGLEEGDAPQKVPHISEYSIESAADKLEVTSGDDENKTYVPGFGDFTCSVSGFHTTDQTSTTDPIWKASRDGNPRRFVLYPNENAANAAEASTVSNKALTSNVATLTTSAPHGMEEGEFVVVAGVDATFNGTHIITAVTSTTFSFAKVAANVVSAAATGTATGPNTSDRYFGEAYFDRSESGGTNAPRKVTYNLLAAGTINRLP